MYVCMYYNSKNIYICVNQLFGCSYLRLLHELKIKKIKHKKTIHRVHRPGRPSQKASPDEPNLFTTHPCCKGDGRRTRDGSPGNKLKPSCQFPISSWEVGALGVCFFSSLNLPPWRFLPGAPLVDSDRSGPIVTWAMLR